MQIILNAIGKKIHDRGREPVNEKSMLIENERSAGR